MVNFENLASITMEFVLKVSLFHDNLPVFLVLEFVMILSTKDANSMVRIFFSFNTRATAIL